MYFSVVLLLNLFFASYCTSQPNLRIEKFQDRITRNGTKSLILENLNTPNSNYETDEFLSGKPYMQLIRSRRSVPNFIHRFARPPTLCSLGVDELGGLEDAVSKANIAITSTQDTSDLPSPRRRRDANSISDQCVQMVANIKTLLASITREVRLFKSSELPTVSQLEAALTKIESERDNYQKLIDNIERSGEQRYNLMMNQFTNQVQNLKQTINFQLKLIEQLTTEVKKANIRTIISDIHSGRITAALNITAELNLKPDEREAFISKILQENYSPGEDDVTSRILNYFLKLNPPAMDLISYPALYNAMSQQNDFNSPNVLLFESIVSKTAEFSWFNSFPANKQELLKNIQKGLKTHVNSFLSSTATNIQHGNYPRTLQYMTDYSELFKPHFKAIVDSAYGGDSNRVGQILPFIRSNTLWSNTVELLTHLTNAMVRDGKIRSEAGLEVITENERTLGGDLGDIPSSPRQILEETMNSVPTNLKFLRRKCTIKNEEYGEYLYAAGEQNYNSERRRVFTWGGSPGEEEDWMFIPENYGKTFKIISKRWNEHLYAAGDTFRYDSSRRRVFSWIGGDFVNQALWKIKPYSDGTFTILNTSHDEYLYAAGDGYKYHGKRQAFTWKNGIDSLQFYWIFSCR